MTDRISLLLAACRQCTAGRRPALTARRIFVNHSLGYPWLPSDIRVLPRDSVADAVGLKGHRADDLAMLHGPVVTLTRRTWCLSLRDSLSLGVKLLDRYTHLRITAWAKITGRTGGRVPSEFEWGR